MKNTFKKLLAIALVFAMCVAFASCNFIPSDNGDSEDASTYVSIDINPSIELTLSADGKVLSVYGANEDGQVLLYEEESEIVGKAYEDAVKHITELAIELGYLSEENPDVTTSISSGNADAEQIRNKISQLVRDKATELGITATVTEGISFEIQRQLDALKEKYPDNTNIQNLTPEKFKLALRACENGDITITAAAELPEAELIEKIHSVHNTIGQYATEAYLTAKAKANALFDTASGLVLDAVYTEIFAARAAKLQFDSIHLGAMYQAYKTTERTYRAIADIMKFAKEYTSLEIDSEIVDRIAAELSITDTTVIEDENGNVTIDSVVRYCNKIMQSGLLTDAAYDAVSEILKEAEDAAQLVVMAGEAYRSELTSMKSRIETVITSVSATSSALILNNPVVPEEAKAEFRACLEDLNAAKDKLGEILQNGATEEEIATLADEAKAKAAAVSERIEQALTDDEKATVEAKTDACTAQIELLRESFNTALTNAENQAKDYIANLREARNSAKNGDSSND